MSSAGRCSGPLCFCWRHAPRRPHARAMARQTQARRLAQASRPRRDGSQLALKLLYLSWGSKDGLFAISHAFHRYLKEHGIVHVWNVEEYRHDRESWADNQYHFSRLIFR